MKHEKLTLAAYIRSLRQDGLYWLSRKEAIKNLQVSEKAFQDAAYRLSIKGSLKRVRSDFFIIIPPEHHAIGSLPPIWFIDALMKHLNQKYYVGLLSASALYGAAHQQPMSFQVITNKRTRSISVGDVYIDFSYKKNIRADFYGLKKSVSGSVHVSTPEMTAYDLLRYPSKSGQINHIATVLSELSEQINPHALAKLLEANAVDIRSAQRLGYVLDSLGLDINLHFLESALTKKNVSRCLLVAESNVLSGEYNKKWRVVVNEQIEVDEL